LISVSGDIFSASNLILGTRADRRTAKGLLITPEACLTFLPCFAEGSASGAFSDESPLISSTGYSFQKHFSPQKRGI
jgi:hypothetical protein